MRQPVMLPLLSFLLFAVAGCPASEQPADVGVGAPADVDAAAPSDVDEHSHGTGNLSAHIHAILRWGDTDEIVLGTHAGMYRTEAGSDELVPVFEGPDFMGLVQDPFDPDRYWASGHWPGAGMNNWGFAESTDGGASFSEISLTNQADFHQRTVSPDQQGVGCPRPR